MTIKFGKKNLEYSSNIQELVFLEETKQNVIYIRKLKN